MWMLECALYAAAFMILHQSISHIYATRHARKAIEIFEEAMYRKRRDSDPKDIMYYVKEVKSERSLFKRKAG